MMGKGLEPSGSALVFCIILILVGIFMMYFDNQSHGHFGTIRQQIWSTLHFPLHLAIVGVVEGAQQVALARYVLKSSDNLGDKMIDICLVKGLEGDGLISALSDAVTYYKLDEKAETLAWAGFISEKLDEIGANAGVCSGLSGATFDDLPNLLLELHHLVTAGIYTALGIKISTDKYLDAFSVALESWKIVYRYFWTANAILFAVFIIFTILIRRNKFDFFDFTSLLSRLVVLVIVAVFLGLSNNQDRIYNILHTIWVLPVTILLLYLIILLDRLSRWIANRRNRKSGEPLIEDHGDGHDDHGHDAVVEHKTGVVASSQAVDPTGNHHDAPPQGAQYSPVSRRPVQQQPAPTAVPTFQSTPSQPQHQPYMGVQGQFQPAPQAAPQVAPGYGTYPTIQQQAHYGNVQGGGGGY
jgi:hypothetical protein